MRISQRRTATSFYGYDAGGSVRQLFDNTGTVTDTYAYDAFGNTVAQTGSTVNEFQYRGEQYDPSLQMYYLRARYYPAQTGRFRTLDISEGDEDDPSTLHGYLYVGADPVNWIDPDGHANLLEGLLKSPPFFAAAVFITGYATYQVVQGQSYNQTATDAACSLKKAGSVLSNALTLMGVAPAAIFAAGACRLPLPTSFKGERRRTRPGGAPIKVGSGGWPKGGEPDGKGGWRGYDPDKGWYPKGRGYTPPGWPPGKPSPIPDPPAPPEDPGTPPANPGAPNEPENLL